MTDYSVARDYYGRVLVMPPGADPLRGEWVTSKNNKRYFKAEQKEARGYGRTSAAAEHLKGGGDGLANWKASMAAIGTVMSKTVQAEIATLINEYSGDPWNLGDDGGWRSGKRRLLDVVSRATDLAGSNSASARGTEFHKLGELVNKGRTPMIVRDELVQPLRTYQASVEPLRFLHQEMLIVNDEIERCGSADYLVEIPAGTEGPDGLPLPEPWVVVSDLKTGKHDANYPIGVFAQLAGYGKGSLYNQQANQRMPLHANLNTDWGVLIHFPLAAPNPEVKFYWVDLNVGLRIAKLNNEVDTALNFFKSVKGKPLEFKL